MTSSTTWTSTNIGCGTISTPTLRESVVLFDLDGVLIAARPWHREALRQALREQGLDITPAQEAEWEGLPTRVKLANLGLGADISKAVADEKQRLTLRLLHANARPLPNVLETLKRLRLEGKRIGICSNAMRATVYAAMWRTGIAKYIDLVLSNEEARVPKPDPCIYLMALSCIKERAENVVAVEDNEKGVRAARGAGIRVVQVSDPSEVAYWRLLEEEVAQRLDPRGGSRETV